MPRLPKELSLYPASLLDNGEVSAVPDEHWWALHTLSRQEKKLVRRLLALDVPFYCPMVCKRSRTGTGRVVTSYVPLFAGYVFIYGNADQRLAALKTNCVSRDLSVDDGAQLVRDLWQIRRLLASDAPLTPESRLAPGTPVRVRSGPLAGIEGVVAKRRSRSRLIVSVNLLQHGVSLEVDDFLLESI